MVGEHCDQRRRYFARNAGAVRMENVGMSNDNGGRTPRTENPRVPGPRQTARVKPGTKPNPKGAGDDEAVNIPLPVGQAKS